jgi:hypothetical protein
LNAFAEDIMAALGFTDRFGALGFATCRIFLPAAFRPGFG